MASHHFRYGAFLFIGPTGSGKSPLGDYLEERGLWRQRCVHFDFGAKLREITTDKSAQSIFTTRELGIIDHSLRTGMLLEDAHFPVAEKILRWFIEEKDIRYDDLIVLNEMPRHVGQATHVDEIVQIQLIVYLQCSADVVHQRIRMNTGCDRTGRNDDSVDEIQRKLRTFRERTIPLMEHYRSKDVKIIEVKVGVYTTPEDVYDRWFTPLPS